MSDYLIGGSPAIKRIKASLKIFSGDTSPLVIIGEPGVGKSLLSSRIHAHSVLKDRDLETVNFKILSERDQRVRLLGGNPPELPTTRRSILELPTTVVLKHIDCAPKFLQERLTEAIHKREIARLGSDEARPIRCRKIFVFNDTPNELFRKGTIISELSKTISKYHIIKLPPLKKRKEDIPELAQHFFTQFQMQRRKKIDHKFLKLLLKHKWEMNILSLKSFIRTLYIPPVEIAIQQNDQIELAKMNLMIDEGKEFSMKEEISRLEQLAAKRALNINANCRTQTAQDLGMSDFTLRQLVKSLGKRI